jgi:hypothetical protein
MLVSKIMSRSLFAKLIPSVAGLRLFFQRCQHRRLARKTKYDVEDYSFGKTQTDDADARQKYCRCRMFLLCGKVSRGVRVWVVVWCPRRLL